MEHLKPSQVAQLNRKLMLRQRELREKLPEEAARVHAERLAGGDAADEAAVAAAVELDAAIIDRHLRELGRIEVARARLSAGTYGICLSCGGEIPWQRLLANPLSERCLPCADQHERIYAQQPARI